MDIFVRYVAHLQVLFFFLPFKKRRIYRTPTLSSTSLQTAINPINLFCSWVVVVVFFFKMQMKCWLLFPVLVGIDLKRYFVQLTFIWRDSRCSLVGGFFSPYTCTECRELYFWESIFIIILTFFVVHWRGRGWRDKSRQKTSLFPSLENRLNVWRTIYLN